MDYPTEQQGDSEKIAEAKKQHEKETVRRARVTTVTFGIISGIALISIVYAFVLKGIADENLRIASETQLKLVKCAEAANQQMLDSQNAMMQMNLEIEKLRAKK